MPTGHQSLEPCQAGLSLLHCLDVCGTSENYPPRTVMQQSGSLTRPWRYPPWDEVRGGSVDSYFLLTDVFHNELYDLHDTSLPSLTGCIFTSTPKGTMTEEKKA